MSTAVLGIGSNLGDRRAHLQSAVDAFRPWLVAVSPVYETPPWGPVEQPAYLNAVLIVADPAADADTWLDRAHAVEAAAGRTRDVRWGARTLDVDVLSVDTEVRVDPSLTLPHPRATQRAFVLVPWLAVDPRARVPARGPVADLLARLPVEEIADVVARPELSLTR
jgi:2-amino-4-hydroxy-6-hydroxymethyldihydropteridine diphosphokinase